jgi:hypothetical protein
MAKAPDDVECDLRRLLPEIELVREAVDVEYWIEN